DQHLEELHRKDAAFLCRSPVEDPEQGADALQGLFETLEQERLRHARAELDGPGTKMLDLLGALLQQYPQVPVIVILLVRLQQPLVIGTDELGHLPLLGDKSRIALRDPRV